MSVILISRYKDASSWTAPIERLLPGLKILVYPEVGDPGAVEVALVHRPALGLLKAFPNLRAVVGLFAGVDGLVADPDLPDVPISRMVDPLLARDVAHYVVLHALRHYRREPEIEANQRAAHWGFIPPPPLAYTVGIMGIGHIGALAARMLRDLGFSVRGWSRTTKAVASVETFSGEAGLAPFLAGTDCLALLLPLTAETRGILNARTIGHLPPGASVINAGRGALINDSDLLAALDAGRLSHATLDVFNPEPPPPESRFWTHPRVTVTPHNAGDPRPESIAETAAENVRRALAGKPLLYPVDRKRGY